MESKKKDKYRTRNWKEYNRSLVNRGSITFWFEEEALKNWYSLERTGKPGRPDIYSDAAIRCGLMIKAVFRVALRALQGFIQSIFQLLGLQLICPHYSVFSRRAKDLQIPLRKLLKPGEKLNVIFDSTGIKVFGEGEWKVRKFGYCKRRTWRKVHIGMDADTGQIVVGAMSSGNVKDDVPMLYMMEALEGGLLAMSLEMVLMILWIVGKRFMIGAVDKLYLLLSRLKHKGKQKFQRLENAIQQYVGSKN